MRRPRFFPLVGSFDAHRYHYWQNRSTSRSAASALKISCLAHAFTTEGMGDCMYPWSLKKYPAHRHPGDPGRAPVCHLRSWCPGRTTSMVGVRQGHRAEWSSQYLLNLRCVSICCLKRSASWPFRRRGDRWCTSPYEVACKYEDLLLS